MFSGTAVIMFQRMKAGVSDVLLVKQFYFLLYTSEESIGFTKIFDIRFSMDLQVLRCPEHDLTIFRKCMSIGLSVYLSPKFCGHCISRTNAGKLMKLYIQLHLDINLVLIRF